MELTNILLLLFVNALYIYGFYAITHDGMLFAKQANYIRGIIGAKASKPIFDCPICMSSFHGSFLFIIFGLIVGLQAWALLLMPVYCVSLAGLIYLINTF